MNIDDQRILIAGLIEHHKLTAMLCRDYGLTPECLSDMPLRDIWDITTRLNEQNGGLCRYDVGRQVSSNPAIQKAFQSVPADITEPSVRAAVHAVSVAHRRATLQRAASEMMSAGLDPDAAVQELQDVLAKAAAATGKASRTIDEIMPEAIERWRETERARALGDASAIGIPLPWQSLTAAIGNLRYGVMSVLGAYMQTGKSSATRQIAAHAAAAGIPVGLISLEDPQEVAAAHIASLQCRFSPYHLDQGESIKPVAKVEEEVKRMPKLPIYVYDRPSRIADIEAQCYTMADRYGCRLFVVDHIQYILADQSTRSRSRNDEVASWSGRLAAIPRNIGKAHLIAVSQLRRHEGTGKPRKPSIHDLRDSGAIGQDARMVQLLYDTEEWVMLDGKPSKVHCLEVVKNNFGPAGAVIKMVRNHGPVEFMEVES